MAEDSVKGSGGAEGLGSAEDRARRMGWVPLEEFRGDPDRWVEPDVYVDRASEHLPIMKGTLTTMERKMVAQERELAAQTKRIAELQGTFKEFVEFSRKAEDRAYAKALAELKSKQRTAVAEGDTEAFDAVSAEIDEHIRNHPAVAAAEKDGGESAKPKADGWTDQEALDEWMESNDWYFEHPNLANYAGLADRKLSKAEPGLTHRQRLERITDMVKEKFPKYFTDGGERAGEGGDTDAERPPAESGRPRQRPSGVEGGGFSGGAGNGKRSYANLPADAKAACDRFVKEIPGYTREEFLEQYQWD